MLKIASSLTADQEDIVYRTIGCALAVHRELGPGFKEAIYHRALCLELDASGLRFESEKMVEVQDKQWRIGGQKVDVIVEGLVLVELKAVSKLKAIHKAQALSYLKTVKLPVGLLLNFNTVVLKNGMKRIALSERL